MYLAYFGKKLINAINERDGTTYSPRRFFDEVYYPLFFAKDRYLFNANNSPVDQAYKFKTKNPLTDEILERARIAIHSKISNGDRDASVFMGGAATDLTASTSGQINTLQHTVSEDEVLCSWIGAALGVTIEGGLTLLIDESDVMLALYEGWRVYRQVLTDTSTLKGNQVNTWNGQWLSHRFGKQWNPEVPVPLKTDSAHSALETKTWVSCIFALCWHFQSEANKKVPIYAYAFGQMNRTAGFARLNLPQVRYLIGLYEELYTVPSGVGHDRFVELYQTEYGFQRAFEQVDIGLRALTPKDMRGFLDGSKTPKYTDNDAARRFLFQIQEVWIIAMLNNNELIGRATELATILKAYAGQGTRGKATNLRLAEDILGSKTRRDFIDQLANLVTEENADTLDSIVNEITVMPTENVPLFMALTRFKYARLNAKLASPSAQPAQDSMN